MQYKLALLPPSKYTKTLLYHHLGIPMKQLQFLKMSLWSARQARSKVSLFGGAQYIFRGQDFCFYYMLKTKFSGRNKIYGGTK